ncbi:IucA/IucC family protein [Hahella ganghwensis]|uniref:IucA/IucC family protein n=1 Tax=Hahella ganghwensis TaxID=286420 RepID=UPI00036AC09A|nr:IucA/IucC family protein [Hahella ganghwensis]
MSFFFDPSLNCFFNGLIREWNGWSYRSAQSDAKSTSEVEYPAGWFDIPVSEGVLSVPCRHFSTTGRHHLLAPCLMQDASGEIHPLPLQQAIEAVMLNSQLTAETDTSDTVKAFVKRALESDENMRHALNYRKADMEELFQGTLSFEQAETSLFTGHSIHPCPKARDNFSEEDTLSYAPEYGGRFVLHWYRLKKDRLYVRESQGCEYQKLVTDLIQSDERAQAWAKQIGPEEVLFPCHPFQHKVWQDSARINELMEQGAVIHLGQGSIPWSATSSVRAIYSAQVPWMLKFSLSVKLTNSIRHLQPEELVRGAELFRVLMTGKAQEFVARFPDCQILMEPTAAAICGEDGQPYEETIVLWRENPFRNGIENNTEVLATLLQDDPRNGVSRLEQRLRHFSQDYPETAVNWFRQYLEVAVKPLLIGQADYGLLFGAHQQNIVLKLDASGFPEKMYFRDCQGTGYTQLAYQLYSKEIVDMGKDSANVLEDELGIRLFSYHMIINATFNVISSLCRDGSVPEVRLTQCLRNFLLSVKSLGVRDEQCIHYLLDTPELLSKGNFLIALRKLNENTESDYLAMYHTMANPLLNRSQASDVCTSENTGQIATEPAIQYTAS